MSGALHGLADLNYVQIRTVPWVGPAGPIIVKYVGTVDRWHRLSGNHAPLEGEADALEAALKENP